MPNLKFNEIKQAYRKREVYYTKVLFTVRYTNRQISALTFFAITKTITKIDRKWDC